MGEAQLALLPDLPEQLAPPGGPSAAEITRLLRRTRMRVGTEVLLQESIEETLRNAGVPFEREVRLSAADRIDFLTGTVGIEAKVKYAKRSIFRQLERYAAQEAISALILVTGTAMGMPAEVGGKPVFVVSLGRAAL